MRRSLLASGGAVGAAFLGSLCCIGPLLFVTLGVGAGLASTLEPLRPVFGIVMLGLFALAFYTVYGRRSAAVGAGAAAHGPDDTCALPRSRTREKVVLWTALVVAVVLWTFPTWSTWLV